MKIDRVKASYQHAEEWKRICDGAITAAAPYSTSVESRRIPQSSPFGYSHVQGGVGKSKPGNVKLRAEILCIFQEPTTISGILFS